MGDVGDSGAIVVLVVGDGREIEVTRLDGRTPDLALVDALARLQLAARRQGATVRLRGAPAELRGLLELVGLAGVLPLEARREAERGE